MLVQPAGLVTKVCPSESREGVFMPAETGGDRVADRVRDGRGDRASGLGMVKVSIAAMGERPLVQRCSHPARKGPPACQSPSPPAGLRP